MLKFYIVITLSKITIFFLNIIKKGSSFPGMVALKLDRDILKKFKIPKNIIAVTGSSGKGTTSKMIASLLKNKGFKVLHNHRGGNLKPGITTMLIEGSSLTGKINYDYIVYEIDERYFKQIVKYLKPQTVVITNLVRDQPPRQGNTDFVYEDIKKCLTKETHLILNADDPYLQKFIIDLNCNATYYGIEKNSNSYIVNNYRNLVMEYCPICNHKLKYNYYNFEIYGDFYCPICNFKRPKPEYSITNVDFKNEVMTINNEYDVKILNNILYNIYNIAASVATLGHLKINLDEIIPLLSKCEYDHKLCNHYNYNNKDIFLFYSKNENSTSFNQSLNYISRNNEEKIIIVGWKTISHRYKFTDISWIYDINFELLLNNNVKSIICIGNYAYDIAVRLKLAGFNKNDIKIFNNLNDSINLILKSKENVYIVVNPDYVIPLLHVLKGNEK